MSQCGLGTLAWTSMSRATLGAHLSVLRNTWPSVPPLIKILALRGNFNISSSGALFLYVLSNIKHLSFQIVLPHLTSSDLSNCFVGISKMGVNPEDT